MHWTVRLYRFFSPVIGHRAAHWLTEYGLAVSIALLGVFLFWLMLAIFPHERGGNNDHQECGSGPLKYDC